MTLRIAFCGPNLELNRKLALAVKDLIYEENLDFEEVPNPLEHVARTTGRDRFEGHDMDWANLWGTSIRRMMLENTTADVVISATCGIDQLAYEAAWLAQQMAESQSALALVDAKGQPIAGEQAVWINRSGAVVQVILNSTEEEVFEYWDFVYSVLPVVSASSPSIDALVFQYKDFLDTAPAFQQRVKGLPDNEEAAMDALRAEVATWRQKIASSS